MIMPKQILRLYAVVAAMVCLVGCWGGEKSVEMDPVETVEAFCKAITSGEWEKAEALCDTLSMQEYIEGHKQAWTIFEKEDESAMQVAKSILENTTVIIGDMHKADEKRVVTYTIEADGLSKTKKATLKKEEGAWIVERITDRL